MAAGVIACRCLVAALAGWLLLLMAGAGAAAERNISLAGVEGTLWTPTSPPTRISPLIGFSHGFHGCSTQSRFLMQAFAAAGYFVVAPNHRDATCGGGIARWFEPAEAAFGHPEQWTPATYSDRRDDIVRLLAALRGDHDLGSRVDWSRVALAGHSLGGYTALALGGAWPRWRLPGIKAVLALSPYTQPWVVRHDLSGLVAPVMYQGGTFDIGITPAIEKAAGAYALSAAPKYYVEFAEAGHLAWADIGRGAIHPEIAAYSIAFLERYVRGAAPAPLLTQPQPGVARLYYDSELGRSTGGR